MSEITHQNRKVILWVACSVLAFTLFTVYVQVRDLKVEEQIFRHQTVLQGTSQDPWQYRILSAYLVEWFIQFLQRFPLAQPEVVGFIAFRVLQNILLFTVGYLYYRQLGLNLLATLVGLSILAWGMSYGYYDSDLQFNTYFDITFYLLAGWLILKQKYYWFLPLIVVAALNRETSGLIPLMLLGHFWISRSERPLTHKLFLPLLCLAIYAAIFFGLRYIYGPHTLFLPHGHEPGINLFLYNIGRPITWILLFATLGIFPFLATAVRHQWSPPLWGFFWVIVPIWLLIHLFNSVMAEARLLLVPQALVFIPGALYGILQWHSDPAPQPQASRWGKWRLAAGLVGGALFILLSLYAYRLEFLPPPHLEPAFAYVRARPADETVYITPREQIINPVLLEPDSYQAAVKTFEHSTNALPAGQARQPVSYVILEAPELVLPTLQQLFPQGQLQTTPELTTFYVSDVQLNPTTPLTINWDDQIILFGYDLPRSSFRPGETIPLTVYWRALNTSDIPYTFFVHLLGEMNPATGNPLWGQVDAEPGNGSFTTAYWDSGEIVIGSYQLPIAADAPPGEYTLSVGFYNWQTSERLPTVDWNGRILDNQAALTRVQITEGD